MVVCLQTYIAQAKLDMPRVVELAQRALALLEQGDPHGLRGAALANLAGAQITMGNIPAAIRTCRELARLGQETGHPISAVSGLSNLAWLLHLQGDAQEAIALNQQALSFCVDARGRPLPLAGQPHIGLGMIYYDLNELASAREHLVQGLDLIKQLSPSTGAVQAAFTLAHIQELMGEREAALTTLRDTRQAASRLHLGLVDAFVAACEADLQLGLGNIEAAARWAQTAGLSPTDPSSFLTEAEHFTFARLLVAQSRPAEAQTLLASLEEFARTRRLQRSLITVRILQTLTEQALGHHKDALAHLGEALRLAAPGGYLRAFLNEGPAVLELLPRVRQLAPEFVDGLLGAPIEASRDQPARPKQALIEPLSERELEVLRLMADGFSNREMAEKLFITVGTIKTHVHNIFGKLAVRGRTQAVAQARQLKLL